MLRESMRRGGLGMLGVAVVLFTTHARADDDAEERIVLAFEADATCGDAASFAQRVRQRTTRARFVEGEGDRTFRVKIVAVGRELRGELTVSDRSGASPPRIVASNACEEVASALALMVALAIDPKASLAPPAPPAPSPPPIPEETGPPPSPLAIAIPDDVGRAPPAEARDHLRLALGASGGVHTGAAPSAAGLIGAAVTLELDRASIFAPLARVGGALSTVQHVGFAAGSARFLWDSGVLDLCPIRLQPWPSLRAHACAGTELGVVAASASGGIDPRSEDRLWAALTGGARFAWEAAPRVFAIDGGVRALLPLRKDRFYVGPDDTLFRVPSVGVAAEVGASFFLFP
jgi:hypothetical protein